MLFFNSKGENKRKRWYRLFNLNQRTFVWLLSLIVVPMLLVMGTILFYTWRAHQFDIEQVVKTPHCSILFDADKKPLGYLGTQTQEVAQWADLPQHLINAFLAREDDGFFDHGGFVYMAFLRSIERNLRSLSYEQGGSTITMQLSRNVFDLRKKSIDRKLLEIFIAQRIEEKYDKETIFVQYLNRIFYGRNCYGIAQASNFYFGKQVKDLDLVESATLAGLIRGPSIFNPVDNMRAAMAVKQETLNRMLELEMITPQQHQAALEAPIHLTPRMELQNSGSYPTMRANDELKQLQERLKESSSGIAAYCSLNLDIQRLIEDAGERAASFIEHKNASVPESWLPLLAKEPDLQKAEALKLSRSKRPTNMPIRERLEEGAGGCLQTCIIVVDSRPAHRGNILAVTAGRSPIDQIDRWTHKLKPGKLFAPFVYCAACQPGAEDLYLVPQQPETCGLHIGYDAVRAFLQSIKLGAYVPARKDQDKLFHGDFEMPRMDLLRLYYALLHEGLGFDMSLLRSVYTLNDTLLYSQEIEKTPEVIRREAAITVTSLPPFHFDGRTTQVHEILPEYGGAWSMVSNKNGVTVFVWIGFDDPSVTQASHEPLNALIARVAKLLARDVHERSRAILRAPVKRKKTDA